MQQIEDRSLPGPFPGKNEYLKSSFPKRVKHQSKNRGCSDNVMFGDHVWKRVLHKYVHVYAFECKNTLKKKKIMINLGLVFARPFPLKALIAFWKRALHIDYIMLYYDIACANRR